MKQRTRKQEELKKLCLDCPLGEQWIGVAIKRIKERQYTMVKEDPSALKICVELRQLMKEMNTPKSCPYYTEDMARYF